MAKASTSSRNRGKRTGGSGKATSRGSTKKSTKKSSKAAAGKKAAAKKVAKKTTAKTSATKKAAAKKSPAKKPASKKPTGKKTTAKKAASKKAPPKKTAAKPAASKKTAKPAAKKKAAGKAPASAPKGGASKSSGSKTTKKVDSKAAEAATKKTPNRKGITIVSKKPARKSRATKPTPKFPPTSGRLLGPGSPVRRPLIPSGPSAPSPTDDDGLDGKTRKRKSPFKKRDLDRFRNILLIKRAELIGDVSRMEAEALLGNAGDLSSLPQHLAEQGSDSYERSLSLDLAAADRRLIKEIDDAIERINEGVYGVCERTGNAIRKERLEELPWARYSIEAARAIERSMPPA